MTRCIGNLIIKEAFNRRKLINLYYLTNNNKVIIVDFIFYLIFFLMKQRMFELVDHNILISTL